MTGTTSPRFAAGFQVGDRVRGSRETRSFGRVGTVTRVIDVDGARGGVFEIRWDGERRPSRSAGFELGDQLELASLGPVQHRTGLVVLG